METKETDNELGETQTFERKEAVDIPHETKKRRRKTHKHHVRFSNDPLGLLEAAYRQDNDSIVSLKSHFPELRVQVALKEVSYDEFFAKLDQKGNEISLLEFHPLLSELIAYIQSIISNDVFQLLPESERGFLSAVRLKNRSETNRLSEFGSDWLVESCLKPSHSIIHPSKKSPMTVYLRQCGVLYPNNSMGFALAVLMEDEEEIARFSQKIHSSSSFNQLIKKEKRKSTKHHKTHHHPKIDNDDDKWVEECPYYYLFLALKGLRLITKCEKYQFEDQASLPWKCSISTTTTTSQDDHHNLVIDQKEEEEEEEEKKVGCLNKSTIFHFQDQFEKLSVQECWEKIHLLIACDVPLPPTLLGCLASIQLPHITEIERQRPFFNQLLVRCCSPLPSISSSSSLMIQDTEINIMNENDLMEETNNNKDDDDSRLILVGKRLLLERDEIVSSLIDPTNAHKLLQLGFF